MGRVFATHMDTLSEVTDELAAKGYRQQLVLEPDGRIAHLDRVFEPEEFRLDDIVQFEGPSNPGDEATVFAGTVQSTSGNITTIVRGTLVLPTEPTGDQADAIRAISMAGRTE